MDRDREWILISPANETKNRNFSAVVPLKKEEKDGDSRRRGPGEQPTGREGNTGKQGNHTSTKVGMDEANARRMEKRTRLKRAWKEKKEFWKWTAMMRLLERLTMEDMNMEVEEIEQKLTEMMDFKLEHPECKMPGSSRMGTESR